MSNPYILVYMFIGVVVVSIVMIVGGEVGLFESVNESAYEQAAEDTTTTAEPAFPIGWLAVILVLSVVGVSVLRLGKEKREQQQQPDEITVIQNKYVDGEIRTTTKLEDELAEHVEPYLDDSDVHEIDERLDNGDSE